MFHKLRLVLSKNMKKQGAISFVIFCIKKNNNEKKKAAYNSVKAAYMSSHKLWFLKKKLDKTQLGTIENKNSM